MKYLLSLLMIVGLSSIAFAQTIYRDQANNSCYVINYRVIERTFLNQFNYYQTSLEKVPVRTYIVCPEQQQPYHGYSNQTYRNDSFQRSTNVNIVVAPPLTPFLPLNIGLNGGIPWSNHYQPFIGLRRFPRMNYVNFGNPANAYWGMGGQFGQYLFRP